MWYRATGSSSTPQQPLAHVREEERRGARAEEEEEEEQQQQQQQEQAELEIAISEIARRGAGAGAASELAWLQEQGYTAEQIAALISHFEALPAGGSKEPGGPLLGLGSEQVSHIVAALRVAELVALYESAARDGRAPPPPARAILPAGGQGEASEPMPPPGLAPGPPSGDAESTDRSTPYDSAVIAALA